MTRESLIEPSREELVGLIQTLSAENAALKARIAELERRLGLNSSNSSKPPSSDGLKEPTRVSSLRERSGKTSGAQPGHDGETLRQVANPDHVIEHHPPVCSGCGEPLTPGASGEYAARQRNGTGKGRRAQEVRVSNLLGVGRHLGSQPRAKTSMTIMRARQPQPREIATPP